MFYSAIGIKVKQCKTSTQSRQNKALNDKWELNEGQKYIKAIIGLEKQFSFFLRVAVLHRFYCIFIDILKFSSVHNCVASNMKRACFEIIFKILNLQMQPSARNNTTQMMFAYGIYSFLTTLIIFS